MFAYGSTSVAVENKNKTRIRKETKMKYALCQSMMQLIKGQGHLLWTLGDLSKAFEKWGGLCKFKFILSVCFWHEKCAYEFVIHDKC